MDILLNVTYHYCSIIPCIVTYIIWSNSFIETSLLMTVLLLLLGAWRFIVKYVNIFWNTYSVKVMKIIKGSINSMKDIEITTEESKSSSIGSTATKTIIDKNIPSSLRILKLYGLTGRCVKAIIPKATMNT